MPQLSGVLALIDGDHHPSAVRDALAHLGERLDVRAALFCGGREKLTPDVLSAPARHYGVDVTVGSDLAAMLREMTARFEGVTAVVDLADDPALGAACKLELACTALTSDCAISEPTSSCGRPRPSRSTSPGRRTRSSVPGNAPARRPSAAIGPGCFAIVASGRCSSPWAGAGRPSLSLPNRTRPPPSCWRSLAPDVMPPRTISRMR
jgi:hypothetical protein